MCRETDRDDDGRDGGVHVGAGENAGAGAGPCDSLLAAWTWKRSDGGVGDGRQGGGVGDDRVCSLFSLTWSGGGDHYVWSGFCVVYCETPKTSAGAFRGRFDCHACWI